MKRIQLMKSKRSAVFARTFMVGLMLVSAGPLMAKNAGVTEQEGSDIQSARFSNTAQGATEKTRAELWGLSRDDWQRYRTLMQGIRGSISPASLSPIEVLGIHARTAEERHRYAQRWAMMMREDAERILAFQHAYDEAQQRLFPQAQLIDAVKLAMHQSKTKTALDGELGPTDRVLFFTATDCVACDALLDRLLARLPTIDGIDIYLLDVAPADEGRIREWAGSRKIEPGWVHGRRVTLNVDGGALDKLAARLGDPLAQRPVVLRRRGDAVLPLSSSWF